MSRKIKVSESSGNVFADLDIPESEEALAKAELARQIVAIIERTKMTQTEAAEALGIDQPKVSALMRGRLTGFSAERLMRFLNALGRDVEIVVRRHRRTAADGQPKIGRIKVVHG